MINTEILNTFFSANALSPLLDTVSEHLGCPIIITDNAFHIVSAHCTPGRETPAYKSAFLHGELAAALCAETEAALPPFSAEHIHINLSQGICAGYLFCADARLGYIIYFSQAPFSDEHIVFEGLLAKQLYLERHCGGKICSAEEILTDLLDGKFESEQAFLSACAGTYLLQFKPQRFALINPKNTAFSDFGDGAAPFFRNLSEFFHASHPFFYKGFVVVFLHADHDADILKSLAEKFLLQIVVSSSLENLYGIYPRRKVLEDILSYAASLKHGGGAFLVYEKDFVPAVQLKKFSLMPHLIDERVRAMLCYDRQNNTSLCLTLYTYIICSRSRKQTSARLFTHCNTVSYRLEKIKAEFSLSPDSPEGVLSLLISLAAALIQLGRSDLFLTADPFGNTAPPIN